jgi:hypothetical protein
VLDAINFEASGATSDHLVAVDWVVGMGESADKKDE